MRIMASPGFTKFEYFPGMETFLKISLTACLLCFPAHQLAAAETAVPSPERVRGYLGAGVLYDLENFRGDMGKCGWDDSWGFNLRGGAYLSEYFALEALFQYHNEFASREPYSGYFWNIWLDPAFHTRIRFCDYDFFINGKASLPLGVFRPYALAGIGFVYSQATIEQEIGAEGFHLDMSYTTNTSDVMWRAGGGIDAFLSEHVGLNLEGAYQAGVDFLDDLRFLTLSAGLLYVF